MATFPRGDQSVLLQVFLSSPFLPVGPTPHGRLHRRSGWPRDVGSRRFRFLSRDTPQTYPVLARNTTTVFCPIRAQPFGFSFFFPGAPSTYPFPLFPDHPPPFGDLCVHASPYFSPTLPGVGAALFSSPLRPCPFNPCSEVFPVLLVRMSPFARSDDRLRPFLPFCGLPNSIFLSLVVSRPFPAIHSDFFYASSSSSIYVFSLGRGAFSPDVKLFENTVVSGIVFPLVSSFGFFLSVQHVAFDCDFFRLNS